MVFRSVHIEPYDDTDLVALVVVPASDDYGPALLRKMLGCFFTNAGRGTDDQTGSLLRHKFLYAIRGGTKRTKVAAFRMRGTTMI